MTFEKLFDHNKQEMNGAFVFTPKTFSDDRGYFYESWNKNKFLEIYRALNPNEKNIKSLEFVQDNQSLSRKGVLRGLHYQINPYTQGKLVSCINGEIFDVIVDLRKESKTFGKWAGVYLNEANFKQIWIPSGFAHGFYSLKDQTRVLYKTTDFWDKDSERTIIWNDPTINICWPINEQTPSISDKDKEGILLTKIMEHELF
ncbi:dTDP-4-dehydrorhamnose 3,5-epimerase [Prochlorococcus sp. HOT_208_60]|nr:dTDP-4-dehydrorhamnose 3,5-epimerase [Prochlorococcus sp. HOT_208_60]